ncbi:VCBS repeat-containing protein [Deminuibacter soli]|uniref:VCBS repeat-containing protein n=1 Tax=Deminuibacter soli TaxID=2291815 RepID=UPI001FEBDDE8|nr:FG-GAP-like repeat-containing protein [Deminuibacter soli]
MDAAASGVHFNNRITETDSVNVLNNQYIYNGGGVGIGDFNNDGLPDLYFTGNMVSNKLYLNNGSLTFSDITSEARVTGEGRWCSGVAVVDINNDGWQDIYVCCTNVADISKRTHLLYVNMGLNAARHPVFKECAAAYGLADTGYTTQAAFFDYDNDGDLDVYLLNNKPGPFYQNTFSRQIISDGASNPNADMLYENTGSDSLGHPFYKNVSAQAGIRETGYGLGINICDLNGDGWKDVFVSNDFISGDVAYINNRDKTFTDKAKTYFKHTSFAAMGNSVSDINNDGRPDVIELDMNPEDNYRRKMMLGANNYLIYQNFDQYHYQYQYTRNTLQLNQGPRIGNGDSIGDPLFSEVAYFAGIEATDWSWTPLVADFDCDGWKDLVVTNGFPKDLTDHDFIAYRDAAAGIMNKKQLLSQIPAIKLRNYAFRNNTRVGFDNTTEDWGINTASFSNGAAYADLDNDGDLDYVVNNINDEAFVFENRRMNNAEQSAHYLRIRCHGDKDNLNAIGATLWLYAKGQVQLYENSPYKGYLSTVENIASFGLPDGVKPDSLVVFYNGRKKLIVQPGIDQTLQVNVCANTTAVLQQQPAVAAGNLFSDITAASHINYRDTDYDYIDFNRQRLLPHKLSQYGPALAAGDINGDGLDDLVIGAPYQHKETVLLQKTDGTFTEKDLIPGSTAKDKIQEDAGILLFDADNDGIPDLYISSGSVEMPPGSPAYADRLYLNDGKGNFTLQQHALPGINGSISCVKAADFDKDGDLDLFVGERSRPGFYPQAVSGHLLRNDSKKGNVHFTEITGAAAPALRNIGMICDALWTDTNGDGWDDLLLAGEFMPLTLLQNNHGKFADVTLQTGVAQQTGCWNSLVAGDFDNDGRMDYIAGNMGDNNFFHASEQYPFTLYAKDFNQDGFYDVIPAVYLYPDEHHTTGDTKVLYPVHTRDDMLEQLNNLRKKYFRHAVYAGTAMQQLLPDTALHDALVLHAVNSKTCLFHNNGNGTFTCIPLPWQAQLSSVYAMLTDDFDQDGNLDLLLTGNDYGMEVAGGRSDALNGLLLKGDGSGHFTALSMLQSGICIPGDGKALVKLRMANNTYSVAASQHNDGLKLFALKQTAHMLPLLPGETRALHLLKNGRRRMEEPALGQSFYSQHARFVQWNENDREIQVTDQLGSVRKITAP